MPEKTMVEKLCKTLLRLREIANGEEEVSFTPISDTKDNDTCKEMARIVDELDIETILGKERYARIMQEVKDCEEEE